MVPHGVALTRPWWHPIFMRLCLILALLAPKPALAQDLEVQVRPVARAGQGPPSLTVRAKHRVNAARLTLTREGEPPRVIDLGALAVDQTRTIALPAPVGEWAYQGTIETERWNGSHNQTTLSFTVRVLPNFELTVPDERINLERARLQLKMSRPAGRCEYEVEFDGAEPATGTRKYRGQPPGTWLPLRWRPCATDCAVLSIRLRCWDTKGNQTGLELFPWWLEIPHEDVNFATGSGVIVERELPKLERAYAEIERAIARYGRILSIRLFISGHTDTVGDAEVNQRLSLARARSLAERLRDLGVQVPILYTGFGEEHLAVKTADEVDQPRNRRALYILAVNPPEEGDWHELEAGGTP
jgi:hypothetical protein